MICVGPLIGVFDKVIMDCVIDCGSGCVSSVCV
jgi:hypothetical protein